jgi:hypothetical protein
MDDVTRRDALKAAAAGVLFLVGSPLTGDEKPMEVTLADAVKEFNRRAQDDATGKTQPALTEDEVVAAIRLWDREEEPVTDDIYKAYQAIADTKKLPEGATLYFITKCLNPPRGHEFDVWWINLEIETGGGYAFRVRHQMLRSRPVGQ